MRSSAVCTILLALLLCARLAAMEPPSRPAIDAPELARLGEHAVGVRTVALVQPEQADAGSLRAWVGFPKITDRALTVDIWYPADHRPGATPETYRASLVAEPPAPPTAFAIPGIAVRDAAALAGGHPLVILSHGYSNVTAVFSWLTENLASKGYVVAAIRHEDPPITDRTGFPQLLLRRPLDIAFVTSELQQSLAAEGIADASRTALIGYSMGGYGVLTAAGAVLDPEGQAVKLVPGDLLEAYARGGEKAASIKVKNLRAVVALAPAGNSPLAAWGADGLGAIHAPLLLIAGDKDQSVEYAGGARAIFASATGTTRYLLTFKQAGHAIGFGPAPPEMRNTLWDLDWFEDMVWRKERLIGINLHMITAFLDLYVKGDASRAAYLDGLVPDSEAGQWEDAPDRSEDYSPQEGEITVWKGFQRRHAIGLQLLRAAPGSASGT
jgi:predicted dienelactone hydrolase